MKIYDIFYILGIILILGSVGYFYIDTSTVEVEPDGYVSDISGEITVIDSTAQFDDAARGFYEEIRTNKIKIVYFLVPLGIAFLLAGFYAKRRIEGADLFIDDVDEDEFWE